MIEICDPPDPSASPGRGARGSQLRLGGVHQRQRRGALFAALAAEGRDARLRRGKEARNRAQDPIRAAAGGISADLMGRRVRGRGAGQVVDRARSSGAC